MKEENGPLIALIVFVLLSGAAGTFAWMRHSELIDGPAGGKPPDVSIRELQDALHNLEGEIAGFRAKATELRDQIRKQQGLYDFYAGQYTDYSMEYQRRNKLVEWAGGFENQAGELSGKVSTMKNETLTKINKQTSDKREEMEKALQAKNTDKEAAITRTRQVSDEFEASKKTYRRDKNFEQSTLDESKSVLADLTQREVERANIFNKPAGHVVLSDPGHNLVVIDLGTVAGVRFVDDSLATN
ncbi:MAG: hypothetical protein ABSE73_28730, partial [Planctomycetota bacterium]